MVPQKFRIKSPMVANLSVKVRICIWFEKSGFLGTGMMIVSKTLLIIKNGGYAVFFWGVQPAQWDRIVDFVQKLQLAILC